MIIFTPHRAPPQGPPAPEYMVRVGSGTLGVILLLIYFRAASGIGDLTYLTVTCLLPISSFCLSCSRILPRCVHLGM